MMIFEELTVPPVIRGFASGSVHSEFILSNPIILHSSLTLP
jgi:hypothetical protein